MDFIRRLGIFLVGVSLGIVILAFFFKGKKTEICYFPNCRVLKDIRSKEIVFSENMNPEYKNLEKIKAVFFTGDVDFSKSEIKKEACNIYYIKGQISPEETIVLKVENCFQKARIISVENSD